MIVAEGSQLRFTWNLVPYQRLLCKLFNNVRQLLRQLRTSGYHQQQT
jgi:hypothetical protein